MNLSIISSQQKEQGRVPYIILHVRVLQLIVMLSLLSGCSAGDTARQDASPVAATTYGHVSGVERGGVHIFKGIPYASAPVGELRWKAPQPHKKWSDTLSCVAFGPSPMQSEPRPFRMWTQEFIAPPGPLSEDCLHLNVWTPAMATDEKLPVLVWIYGGGFVSGSGACAVYDGEEIAKMGIVYITINYRVGAFGFMAHPELTAEAEHHSSGNYALLDQIAALRWVHSNIASFGGDPSKVTIAGQSAGSMSVQALVASPLARGLFRGAIAQSGALTSRPRKMLAEAEQDGVILSSAIKSDLAGLRALTADSLLRLAGTLPFGTYSPIVDGYVIPEDPKTSFKTRSHTDVPTMIGWVTGDADLSLGSVQSPGELVRMIQTRYGDRSTDLLKMFPMSTQKEFEDSRQKLGNLVFAAHAGVQWAKLNRSPAYVYQFSYVPTDKPGFPNYGAFHTSEVPFALHTLNQWDRPWTSVDREVEKYMSTYWVNFVKDGSPGIADGVAWAPFDPAEGNIMSLGAEPQMHSGLLKAEMAAMDLVDP